MKKLTMLTLFLYSLQVQAFDLQGWQIKSNANDLLVPLQIQGYSAMRLRRGNEQHLFIAHSHPPLSIKSVKNKLEEMKALQGSLQIVRSKDQVFFYFKTSTHQAHFFSTKGGYLQINLSEAKASGNFLSYLKL